MFANENDCINDLKDKYVKLGHSLFMSSPKFIFDYYKGILSLNKIEDYLSGIDSYTLHRLNKKPRRNYSYTYFWRERMEFDLIEIGKVTNFNNGFRYILVRLITHMKSLPLLFFVWERIIQPTTLRQTVFTLFL